MSEELQVFLSMRFPSLDRTALAGHLGPVVEAVIAAGGNFTNISIAPYEEDDDE
jgi:hypothetical protein